MTVILLLFILIAMLGAWYLGYHMHRSVVHVKKNRLPKNYLVGLNHLLNEEPDKAVDIFVKMLEVDSETVETHLAVGKLFRRRGEVDRAIRIHQNLIARPQLDKIYRVQSLYELGQDYLSAGMFDRAERVFLEIVDIKEYSVKALRALIDIYQQEKSWERAIETARKLESSTRKSMQAVIAHYYCELAELSLSKNQEDQVEYYLKLAIEADSYCVRASLLLAKYFMQNSDYKTAIKHLKRIKTQDPDYLSEAIDALASCYEALNEEDALVSYLLKILEEYPRVPVVLILSERIRKWKGDKIAAKFVADYVRRYPSLSGLALFVNLYSSNVEGRAREDLLIVQGLMKKLLTDKPDYQCGTCGFSGRSLHWQCPGCRQWSSVKPLHCLQE